MTEPQKETNLEIKDVIAVILRRKWLIVLPFLAVTVIAFGGSYALTELYQSSTMVVIDQTQYLSKQLQAFVPGQEEVRFSDLQRKNQLIAIHNEMISSAYLSRLIDELGLAQDPVVVRQAQKLQVKRPDIPVRDLVYHILTEGLRNSITVDFNGENIVQISAESSNPSEAMKIATKLAEIFKDERLKRELSGVRGALNFSDEQLAIYRKNLDAAEDKKGAFATEYLRNQLDESVSADTNIRAIMADIDNIKLLISDNIKEQADTRTRLAGYRSSQLVLDTDDEYEEVKTGIFSETQRLADFMSKYTWSDPKVLNANLKITDQLRRIEGLVSRYVRQQFGDASSEAQGLLTEFFVLQLREVVFRQKLNDFEVSLSTLRNRIASQPQYEIQMRNLENEVTSAREIFEKFKDQLTGSEISQSLMRGEAESKYRIMEPASVPIAPVKPNRMKIAVLGGILGLVIGGVAAMVAELLDNSFKRIEDVEEFLKVPVLATIPGIAAIKNKVKAG
jgi:uncharacterized protein involved in exopolysaccharide biosynthesis